MVFAPCVKVVNYNILAIHIRWLFDVDGCIEIDSIAPYRSQFVSKRVIQRQVRFGEVIILHTRQKYIT